MVAVVLLTGQCPIIYCQGSRKGLSLAQSGATSMQPNTFSSTLFLQADKRQMKTKQLHKALVQVAVSKHNLPDDHRGQLLQQVGVKLASSSQFSNKGKYTSLVE